MGVEYLAEVVLRVGEDPIVTVQLLDSDRHQRVQCVLRYYKTPINTISRSGATLAFLRLVVDEIIVYSKKYAILKGEREARNDTNM